MHKDKYILMYTIAIMVIRFTCIETKYCKIDTKNYQTNFH